VNTIETIVQSSAKVYLGLAVLILWSMPALGFAAEAPSSTGEQLFRNNCMACHQALGEGIQGIYPSLADSEVVSGNADDVALVVLIGRGDMPSFKGSLNSADLAAIINYVRNAWGNSGATISAERVVQLAATVD
jgi:cytochrome c oxidase subunit 2